MHSTSGLGTTSVSPSATASGHPKHSTSNIAGAPAIPPVPALEPGVSFALASYRKAVLQDIQYTLAFQIPAKKQDPISGTETVRFRLRDNKAPLQLDFKQPATAVHQLAVNGRPVAINLQQEHLLLPAASLRKGENNVTISFTAGDASLNRNDEYVYALFVPDRARTVFPCFDQPNLKSRFRLTLDVPSDWKVLANGSVSNTLRSGDQTRYFFFTSDPLPTYLFSFTAGKYQYVEQPVGERSAHFLYRETDTAKIHLSVDSIFLAHQAAIRFLEQWTGIPFPFQKVGFVGIPDFQFGGMEHPGEVQYKASSLFLDQGATKDQYIARANLISHETAHMWFGDLVTMQWFNDVWMKEVFANFMADKVTEKVMGNATFNQKFLLDHYPAAYGVDRTPGANPIRQQLGNLQEAGTMYGNIIYHKAPIMMRQLELLMGANAFRQGIREYLKTYAYDNATWPDLIKILGRYTPNDLEQWNKVWVNETGRPVFSAQSIVTRDRLSALYIDQQAESGNAQRVWPQYFNISLVYPGYDTVITVAAKGAHTVIPFPQALPVPQHILFNTDGRGYGLFPVDSALGTGIFGLPNGLQRAAIYINDYENMLAGRTYKPADLLRLFVKGLPAERDEMNLRLLSGYITNIYWEFIPATQRSQYTAMLETALWTALEAQEAPNNRKLLFKAYQDVYSTAAAQARIYAIWQDKKAPPKVTLSEDDYTSLALSIALKADTAATVLDRQLARIADPDRRKRLQYLQPALSPDSTVRDRFFAALSDRASRQKEAWVVTALYYLHHPLRQQTALKYLPQSLSLLEEIQRTGDIFFPQSWLNATFSMYQDPVAWQAVETFLQAHPGYNPKLKAQILQATDNLRRTQTILH
ncbi:aminopeptidase [Chitinophaga parva]|uniref:Aminopeptidase N n=2 Tax=Chitinophaga parva TaxID=2169414 RepID=A0A2T7BEJ2_9BACT|nr:aminopeptidase [Chitinophaga parva]